MSYSDRFNILTVEVLTSRKAVDEDGEQVLDDARHPIYEDVYRTYDVKDLHLSNADMFLASLAVQTDIEDKQAHPNPKNDGFLRAYRTVYSGMSLDTITRRIVDLYDRYRDEEFAPEMFYSYKRWGRGKMGKKEGKRAFISDTFDETCGYDPYVFSSREKSTSLSQASLTLLAKALRFFLEETLRHFFQKSDPNSWYPSTDKKGKRVVPECNYRGTLASASFTTAISELLELFNSVYSWSPHLDEFSEATARAVEAGRADRDAKSAKRLAESASNRSYGVSDGKPRQKTATASASASAGGKYEAISSKKAQATEPKKPKLVRVTVEDDEGWVSTEKVAKGTTKEATASSSA